MKVQNIVIFKKANIKVMKNTRYAKAIYTYPENKPQRTISNSILKRTKMQNFLN